MYYTRKKERPFYGYVLCSSHSAVNSQNICITFIFTSADSKDAHLCKPINVSRGPSKITN